MEKVLDIRHIIRQASIFKTFLNVTMSKITQKMIKKQRKQTVIETVRRLISSESSSLASSGDETLKDEPESKKSA